jgi:hypothetical protein
MATLRVDASALIAAPPAVVYALISDYHRGHPSILPPEYFEDLVVEEGGQGDGTRVRLTMKVFGAKATSRARITEPIPGRVLVETVEGRGIVTTFTVEPSQHNESKVTLTTEYPTKGVRGWFEALVVQRYLRRVYAAELRLLAQRASEASGGRTNS